MPAQSRTHQATCALARAQGTSELQDLASPCTSIYQGQWQFGPISTPVRPTYTLPAPRDRSSHGSSQLASEALCSCIALRSRVAVASQHTHSGFSCCCCPLLSVPRPISQRFLPLGLDLPAATESFCPHQFPINPAVSLSKEALSVVTMLSSRVLSSSGMRIGHARPAGTHTARGT